MHSFNLNFSEESRVHLILIFLNTYVILSPTRPKILKIRYTPVQEQFKYKGLNMK